MIQLLIILLTLIITIIINIYSLFFWLYNSNLPLFFNCKTENKSLVSNHTVRCM